MPELLEYANPRGLKSRWGPILFRPSRRSILLILLTLASAAWLALRHEPWRLLCEIPAGVIPLCLYADYRLHEIAKSGDPFAWTPLDRTIDIAAQLPYIGAFAAAALAGIAVLVIAVRWSHPSH